MGRVDFLWQPIIWRFTSYWKFCQLFTKHHLYIIWTSYRGFLFTENDWFKFENIFFREISTWVFDLEKRKIELKSNKSMDSSPEFKLRRNMFSWIRYTVLNRWRFRRNYHSRLHFPTYFQPFFYGIHFLHLPSKFSIISTQHCFPYHFSTPHHS
jgi:hypothetical protein